MTNAIEYFSRAAALGSSSSLYKLGYIYEMGLEAESSIDTAVEYYRQAADQGNEDAIEALTRLSNQL